LDSNESLFVIERALKSALRYHTAGELHAAADLYNKILTVDPNHADSLHLLGVIACQSGDNDTAVDLINRAIQINSGNAIYYNNIGNALSNQSNFEEASACYSKALAIKPDYAEAHNNMGAALKNQGKNNKAIACFQKALEINPNYVEACNNMGAALRKRGMLNEAIAWYQKALEIRPDYAEAYHNMGNVLKTQGKSTQAVTCYSKALEIKPDYAEACRNLVDQLQQTCSWQELDGLTVRLDAFTKRALDKGTRAAEPPFISLARHADPARNYAIAKSWSDEIVRATENIKPTFSFDGTRLCKRKIVIGYLSNDFCNHPVAHQMLSLYGLHNRDEFQVFCYSYGKDDGSYYRLKIQRDCDRFIDIRDLSHVEAAKRIHADRVDILVDLMGHTLGSRLEICALRPAPVQVSYLGFLGTTGADFFDYIITDRIVTPEDHAQYYSENFVYLPHCYQVNDHAQMILEKDWKKSDFGLPEGSFVFCSFNQGYKIEPVMFNSWMKILRHVPESVLWLLSGGETTEKNLKERAEARSVSSERLIFAKKLPINEHLARLRLAGLALDTRIYNGGATTSNALWAGVPVITMQGAHFVSRMTSSSLKAIGLPDLITHSLEDYEALAVGLARDHGALEGLRQKLADNRLKDSLFDTQRFVKNLERAYKEMWRIFSSMERPRRIEVVEPP